MASVQLRKSDKIAALNSMVLAKYKPRYDELVKRWAQLTQRVYDVTVGKEGNKLKASAKRHCREWNYWLDTRADLSLVGVPVPGLLASPAGRKLRRGWFHLELFSGRESPEPMDEQYVTQQLQQAVAWPDSMFSHSVDIDNADAQTKRVAKTLSRDVEAFNKEVKEFYGAAESVLYRIRSTKQVDAMFPELWDYLPAGLRERIKQGVIPLSQSEVDTLRKRLPKKRR